MKNNFLYIFFVFIGYSSSGQTTQPTLEETNTWLSTKFSLYYESDYFKGKKIEAERSYYFDESSFEQTTRHLIKDREPIEWVSSSNSTYSRISKGEIKEIRILYSGIEITDCSLIIKITGAIWFNGEADAPLGTLKTSLKYKDIDDIRYNESDLSHMTFHTTSGQYYWIPFDLNGEENLVQRIWKAIQNAKKFCVVTKKNNETFRR